MKKLILIIFLAFVAVNAEEEEDVVELANVELDWWEHGVFYQVYPKSFKDSDNDGFGDVMGIIEKFDHFRDLGVTALWLSPFYMSPMADGGYDVENYYRIDPLFGSELDLKLLFFRAKQAGIKIILDFVPNHTSNKHEWFLKSRNRTAGFEHYYTWRDCNLINPEDPRGEDGPRNLPNNWIAVFHTPAWTYDYERKQCYLHQFAPEQPDLNLRNEEVYNAMFDILKYWLDQGADGFRIGSVNHLFEDAELFNEGFVNPRGDRTRYDNLIHINTLNQPESYQFIYDVRAMIDNYTATTDNKTRIIITEVYETVDQQQRWYGEDRSNRGAHIPFNFQLISNLDKNSRAREFKRGVDSWTNTMPVFGEANWVLGNHDTHRVGSRFGSEKVESMAIMTMMLPGIKFIYYGDEIGMVNNRNISFENSLDPQARQTNESYYMEVSRDPVRTPFQWDDTKFAGFSENAESTWLPVHENFETINLKAQKEAEKSTFKLYQELIKLRNVNRVLQIGGYRSEEVTEDVFGFMRTLAGHHTLAVLVNLEKCTCYVNLKDLMKNEFSSNAKARVMIVSNKSELKVGEMIGDVEKIELVGYGAIVIEISSAGRTTVSILLLMFSVVKFIF